MPGRLEDVVARFLADNSDTIAKIRQMRAEYEPVAAMMREGIKITADNRAALAAIGEVKTALAGLPDSKEITVTVKYVTVGDKPGAGLGLGADTAEITRHLQDISTYMDMATDSMGRMETHLGVISRNVQDSSADLMMQTQILRDNADAHNAVAVAAARSATATRDSGAAAAAAGAFAGGGGGGGGGGGFAGGLAGGLAGRIFGGALPTVQAAHMITMFTMEALSTIIPAAVAAGAAGAVGYQAGQTLYGRGTAMYTAAEALGPAYGTTAGQMFGVGGAFQQAQNIAQGGVFGIAGGLKDLAGAGAGAFSGMGVQTVAMIDRGVAAMVLNNRMGAVAKALGGGTGFLRAFGDIGANIGDTLLNLAPNLPGIGPDLLGSLKGITGLAAYTTGHIPGPLLGAGLAAEAGWRWGKPILGGGQLPGWLGGAKFGGLAGLAERLGLGTAAGADASGLAGLLGAGAGPIGLAAALSAFAMTQLASTMPTGAMRQMAGLEGAIGQSFGAGALTPIKALYQAAGQGAAGIPTTGYAGYIANYFPAMQTPNTFARFGPGAGMGPTAAGVYQNAIGGATQVLANLVTAGPSAVKALSDIGIKGATLTQAFEAMSMAMIGPGDYKGGQLGARGVQMLQQFAQTYRTAAIGGQPGTASGLLAAGAADYIMSTPQIKSLSQINQQMDAMTQIMSGGGAGQAALFAMLGGTPVTRTRAGLRLPAGPAYPAMTAALSNIFTPQGAAAWSTFAGPQGMISAQQANLDQMRSWLKLGAISGQQGAQLGAFDLQSMLPLARQSPAALAMLMSMGMQANIPGMSYYTGTNQAANYARALKAITGSAGTAGGAMGIINQGTINTANLPAIAASLITGGMGGPSALESGLTAQMAQQALTLAGHPLLKGGGVNMAALQGLTSSLAMGGVKPGQMTVAVDAILQNLHVPSGLTAKVNAEINAASLQHVTLPAAHVKVTPEVDAHAAVTAVAAKTVPIKGTIEYQAKLPPVPPEQHGRGIIDYVTKLPAAPVGPTGHGVIIYTNVVTGVVGRIGGHTAQHGMLVPGHGSGDVVPAMLEPGELVVPRNMVGSGMVDHLKGRIPGFQGGGVVAPSVAYFPGMGAQLRAALQDFGAGLIADMAQILASMRAVTGTTGGGGYSAGVAGGFGGPLPVPAAASKVFDAFERTFRGMGAPWGRLASQILTGLEYGIRNAPHETKKMAQALVNQVKSEISYGQGVASAALAGTGFTPSGGAAGLLSTFTGLPQPVTAAGGAPYQYYLDQATISGGGTVSVQQQMGDYLQAMRSFQADTGALAKGGLSRGLLRQLFSAGPIAGDQLAQSILSGPGGIKGANQLQAQIAAASKALGVASVGDVYGMPKGPGAVGVHADVAAAQAAINGIHGKSVTISVNVALTGAGGGGGGGGGITIGPGGTVELTPAAVKSITSQIQSALLKQAKRNRGTNIRLPGYGG